MTIHDKINLKQNFDNNEIIETIKAKYKNINSYLQLSSKSFSVRVRFKGYQLLIIHHYFNVETDKHY